MAEPGGELFFGHREPVGGRHGGRVEQRSESRIGVQGCPAVVGAAALAAVAAENPAVEVQGSGRFAFDGAARDAAAGVDGAVLRHSSRGAGVDAVAAFAAARAAERRVVALRLVAQNQFAQ